MLVDRGFGEEDEERSLKDDFVKIKSLKFIDSFGHVTNVNYL
jgi:hypothetical protein